MIIWKVLLMYQLGANQYPTEELCFALFICYAVYAELFLLDTDDDRLFFENIVLPAVSVVEKNFGMLPLITHISPVHLGADISWKYYPEFVKTCIYESASKSGL